MFVCERQWWEQIGCPAELTVAHKKRECDSRPDTYIYIYVYVYFLHFRQFDKYYMRIMVFILIYK